MHAGDPRLPMLTALPDKQACYRDDTYFRQSWAHMEAICGSEAVPRVQRLGTMLLRPEAVAGRRVGPCVQAARQHGFRPVAFRVLTLTRHMALDLWRYQHNAGTLDRISVTEMLFTGRPSVLVVVSDEHDPGALPAAVRMHSVKGANDPAHARPGTIRHAARPPCRMLSMVHTADEPADVVRELGLLFGRAERQRLIREGLAGRDASAALTAVTARLYRQIPHVVLDHVAAAKRVIVTLRAAGLDAAAAQVTAAAAGRAVLRFDLLLTAIEQAELQVAPWDLLQAAAAHIRCDESDEMLVRGDGESEWRARLATDLDA